VKFLIDNNLADALKAAGHDAVTCATSACGQRPAKRSSSALVPTGKS
jgi:hypothetical protein